MSDSLIRSTRIGSIYIQSGYGVPTHINVIGSLYVDQTNATLYINKNGINDWEYFFDSSQIIPSGVGVFVHITGDTMTGNLIVPNVVTTGVTASTISNTNYIDFTTGTTNPSAVGGRLFFNNDLKALSYYDIIDNNVPIAMGQQLYTRVWNATGVQIDKGKVIAITGTSNGLPSAILAVNSHAIGADKPIGLAAENIPNNSEGLVLNNGILSGITLNTFDNGDTLYLSDTVAGGYVSSTSSLAFSARTNEIGYVIQTGTTTGKIYVSINNEDSNLSLTDIERNILEGNVISTGVYQYTGMTQGTGQTINVALIRGWIVRNTYEYSTLPDVTNVYYTGGTNIPLTYLNSADSTYILVNSGSTLYQQTTFPTPQQRRENIYLGKVVHPNRTTITSLNQTVDFDVSPMAAIRDIWTPIKLINQGLTVSPNGANLSINVSSGALWGNGIGWVTNQQNPDSVAMSGTSPTTFQYRSQLGPVTGATPLYTGNTTFIDATNYDVGGVVTNVPGSGNFTTQRIYKFPTGLVRIQYGQAYYPTLAKALAELQNENFIEYGNNRDNGILIGLLTVKDGTADLSDTNNAIFHIVSKFGELTSGSAGISTTTLQQAYDNSTTPEIVINATLDGLSVKNGTGNADNVTNNFEVLNAAGSTTAFLRADGYISGTTFKTDGFIANNNGLTGNSLNVTGTTILNSVTATTISATTIITPGVRINNGLTANTISATTYQNLPTDIRVTGGTYSASVSTIIFTNNTGGTFNVTGITATGGGTFTGGTVTGATSFTAGLTANTISATTYQNLPTDIRVTGGTYTAGTSTFTNNTGGTFSVTGFSKYFVTGATPSGVTINNGDRWFDTTNGVELVYFNDGDSSQWVQTNDSATITGDYLPLNGGTVTGATTFTAGLYTNVISATTYQNLPTDIRVTGSTYSNNTFTYTNNTGGTFNVLFNTLTGLTVNGNLTVTGTTSSTSFSGGSLTLSNSASTISLNNTSRQQIRFFSAGTGVPTYNTYSAGAKIIFSDNISSISSGYAIGVDAGSLWYGADLAGNGHDWYAGTRKLASLVGSAGFQLIGLGGPGTSAAMTISGTSALGSKGGTGYTDFLQVINNWSGATNPNKWFRVNSIGGFEILNSAYSSQIFSLTDTGILSVAGGNLATTSSSDGVTNYLMLGNNNTQIYDDGNTHIHSRTANQSMWINTNGGQLNLLTQSPTATGSIGSGIAIATGTLNGYVTINTGRTITTSAAYGYLTTGGAGTYPGGSQSVSISLYANSRIWGQEIDAFSDERMKDIQGEITLEEGLKLVNNLKPIKYTWKEGEDKGLKAGYSAQQVIKSGFNHLIGIIPKEGLEERVDDDGFVSPKDTQFSMNYDQVTPYHGVVIKHLLEKIEQLELTIKDLQNKIK